MEPLKLTKRKLVLQQYMQMQGITLQHKCIVFYAYAFLCSDLKLRQDLEEFKDLTLKDFTYIGTLGMGGFGRVELVRMYS